MSFKDYMKMLILLILIFILALIIVLGIFKLPFD